MEPLKLYKVLGILSVSSLFWLNDYLKRERINTNSSERHKKKISLIIFIYFFGIILYGCKPIINKFAFHPDNIYVLEQKQLPLGIEEFVVITEDNIKIKSLYLPVISSDNVLIYFHGNAGNIYHRIPSLLQLQKFGLNVVGVSYRGYGKSEGNPSEDGIYLDGKAILTYVIEDLGFSNRNIVMFSRSLGTTVAINTAQHEKIAGLILVTPLTSGRDQATVFGLGLVSSLAGNSFNNIAKISNIDTPILVIHGTKDRVIPYLMGKKIFNAAKSRKTLITIEGAGHNNLQDKYSQEYWLAIFHFLNHVLSK